MCGLGGPVRDVKQQLVNNGIIRYVKPDEEKPAKSGAPEGGGQCGPQNEQQKKPLQHRILELDASLSLSPSPIACLFITFGMKFGTRQFGLVVASDCRERYAARQQLRKRLVPILVAVYFILQEPVRFRA
jgi:hypothetical protein